MLSQKNVIINYCVEFDEEEILRTKKHTQKMTTLPFEIPLLTSKSISSAEENMTKIISKYEECVSTFCAAKEKLVFEVAKINEAVSELEVKDTLNKQQREIDVLRRVAIEEDENERRKKRGDIKEEEDMVSVAQRTFWQPVQDLKEMIRNRILSDSMSLVDEQSEMKRTDEVVTRILHEIIVDWTQFVVEMKKTQAERKKERLNETPSGKEMLRLMEGNEALQAEYQQEVSICYQKHPSQEEILELSKQIAKLKPQIDKFFLEIMTEVRRNPASVITLMHDREAKEMFGTKENPIEDMRNKAQFFGNGKLKVGVFELIVEKIDSQTTSLTKKSIPNLLKFFNSGCDETVATNITNFGKICWFLEMLDTCTMEIAREDTLCTEKKLNKELDTLAKHLGYVPDFTPKAAELAPKEEDKKKKMTPEEKKKKKDEEKEEEKVKRTFRQQLFPPLASLEAKPFSALKVKGEPKSEEAKSAGKIVEKTRCEAMKRTMEAFCELNGGQRDDVPNVKKMEEMICFRCGLVKKNTASEFPFCHIESRYNGGADVVENGIVMCKDCNSKDGKHNMDAAFQKEMVDAKQRWFWIEIVRKSGNDKFFGTQKRPDGIQFPRDLPKEISEFYLKHFGGGEINRKRKVQEKEDDTAAAKSTAAAMLPPTKEENETKSISTYTATAATSSG